MIKSNKIKVAVYITVALITPLIFYKFWLSFFNNFVNTNINHGSYFDENVESISQFDLIFNYVIGVLKKYLSNFKSLKAFKIFLLNIPSFAFVILIYLLRFLMYASNFILLVFILYFYLSLSSNENYITSPISKTFIKFINCSKSFFKKIIIKIKSFLILNKKFLFTNLLILLTCSSILPYVVYELVLWLLSYIIYLFEGFRSYILILNTFKILVALYINSFKNKWCIITLPLTIFLIYKLIILFAINKLSKLYDKFKCFIKFDTATVNIWNGAPGSHKSNTIVQAALANTENFIEELTEELFNFEINYPKFNMAYINLFAKLRYEELSVEEIKKIIKKVPEDFLIDLIEFEFNIPVGTIVDDYFKLYYRGSFNCSSIGMVDPYNPKFSINENGELLSYGTTHYLDFNSIRIYKKQDNMFHEEYENIVITEFDKEYASNDTDTKKNASDDGAPAFFAMFSHLVRRHGKIFLDWQDKTQGLRRFRAVAGFFAFNTKAKFKYPFLIRLFRKPFDLLYRFSMFLIKTYKGDYEKTSKKWSIRRKNFKFKRNDVTLYYLLLKYFARFNLNILMYFEHFAYFKIYTEVGYSDEDSNKRKVKYYIPLMNMYHNGLKIYESCQFNRFYADLRDNLTEGSKGLQYLGYWTSIDPGAVEYCEGVKQRFYVKILKAQLDDSTSNTNNDDQGGAL